MDVRDEPRASGSVVRVHTERSKYPEVWVASYINGGRWYPDSDSWMAGSARHDLPDGADWYTLQHRGRVELLSAGAQETYEAGWRAGVAAAVQAVEEVEYEVVFPDSLVGAESAGGPHDPGGV